MKYLQVLISAELRVQGINILTHLIKKRLAFGGPVCNGPAKFLWENEIVEHDYCYVVTYTREDLKDRLTAEAERCRRKRPARSLSSRSKVTPH
jgi:hypothetical protein